MHTISIIARVSGCALEMVRCTVTPSRVQRQYGFARSRRKTTSTPLEESTATTAQHQSVRLAIVIIAEAVERTSWYEGTRDFHNDTFAARGYGTERNKKGWLMGLLRFPAPDTTKVYFICLPRRRRRPTGTDLSSPSVPANRKRHYYRSVGPLPPSRRRSNARTV